MWIHIQDWIKHAYPMNIAFCWTPRCFDGAKNTNLNVWHCSNNVWKIIPNGHNLKNVETRHTSSCIKPNMMKKCLCTLCVQFWAKSTKLTEHTFVCLTTHACLFMGSKAREVFIMKIWSCFIKNLEKKIYTYMDEEHDCA